MFGISRNCAENQSYYYLITSRPMSLSAKIQDPLFQKPGPKDKTFLPNFQRANLVHQLHQPAWAGSVSPDSNCCLWQNLFTLARRAKRSNREKGHPPAPAASAVPCGQKIPVRDQRFQSATIRRVNPRQTNSLPGRNRADYATSVHELPGSFPAKVQSWRQNFP